MSSRALIALRSGVGVGGGGVELTRHGRRARAGAGWGWGWGLDQWDRESAKSTLAWNFKVVFVLNGSQNHNIFVEPDFMVVLCYDMKDSQTHILLSNWSQRFVCVVFFLLLAAVPFSS